MKLRKQGRSRNLNISPRRVKDRSSPGLLSPLFHSRDRMPLASHHCNRNLEEGEICIPAPVITSRHYLLCLRVLKMMFSLIIMTRIVHEQA
jgi:hypothetical protein